MTDDLLAALRAMDESATKGPWDWNEVPLPGVGPSAVAWLLETVPPSFPVLRHEASTWNPTPENRALIIALRNALPELIAYIEAADALKEVVDDPHGCLGGTAGNESCVECTVLVVNFDFARRALTQRLATKE